MSRELGKVTRISVIVAVLVALVMLATPVLQIGGKSVSPIGDVAAANGSRVFNVGIVGFTGSVATLNPFVYTMSSEYDVFAPCYSYLLTYDQDGNRVGDLATSWSEGPDGLLWNFKLAKNAYFIDPAAPNSKAHPVTAADVMWSFWEVNNDSGNHLASNLNCVPGSHGVISSMYTGVDQFDLYIRLSSPFAPFMDALNIIPIMPQYIWSGKQPLNYNNLPPVGSGPFYYGLSRMPTTVGILKRNPIWFQEVNRGWQIHIDTLQYKNEMSTATAWSELTLDDPLIDTYIGVSPSQYTDHIVNATDHGASENLLGFAVSTGFVYEYQLNQLSDALRAKLGMHSGHNNQLLLNPTVKLAMAMCVDKPTFIKNVTMGLGTVADSLVPDTNPWHYTYPNPVQFNPTAARTMLMNAGWAYDSAGNPAISTTVPLYKKGATNGTVYHPLSFRLLSLTTASEWDVGARLLVQWAARGGVQLIEDLVSVNQANSAWYAGNYDTWLWDWVFTPTSDPSTDCMSVDTTMAIGTWSGSYWSNASFDALYNRSLVTMDPVARRILTDQLQASVYEDHNDQLIEYRKDLYVSSTVHWERASYGDWETQWTMIPDQCYNWLYMQLSPVDNPAPTAHISKEGGYNGLVKTDINFGGTSSQSSGCDYQWYWGDGSVTGWLNTTEFGSTTHQYFTDGVYTAYFAVRQWGTSDHFAGYAQTTVTVVNTSNVAPVLGAITMTPSSGINTGTVVNFTAAATDANGDLLYYTWNFNDTYSAYGATVFHQFTSVGTGEYNVLVQVTDNHPGKGRPQNGTATVIIGPNHAPTVSLPSSRTIDWKTVTTFTATAGDIDLDPLRYTWNWGDGSQQVTNVSTTTHSYSQKGQVSLVVHADDLTGLSGHNVSAVEAVNVLGTPSPPTNVLIVPSVTTIFMGQTMSFTGSAKDPTGDAMRFTFTFGDGEHTVINNAETTNNKLVSDTTPHMYNSVGTMTTYMSAFDGQDNTTSPSVLVTVNLNHLPVIAPPLSNKQGWAGNTTSFTGSATDADPGETATLRYTWNFGDGSALRVAKSPTHVYAKAGIYTFTLYVNDLTGIAGHNVSSSKTISVAFNLALKQGWNLVTVPLVGNGYMASTIPGLVTGDVVASWNSATKDYDHTYIKDLLPDDFAIEPNAGYWIWVAAAKTIHLYGSLPTDMQIRTIDLSGAGWIMLGFESLNATRHAGDIVGMYMGSGAITMISAYDAVSGYTDYIAVIDTVNFTLVPGQAYWCWFAASGQVNGALAYVP
jgi:ABC-type oligopeptide transport system substrate-binding subunit/PKD repeat protein